MQWLQLQLILWFFSLSFQNLLFYYENENVNRPAGVIFLEGCYCERLINPPQNTKDEEEMEKTVSRRNYDTLRS